MMSAHVYQCSLSTNMSGAECFTHTNSFKPHNSLTREIIFLFYKDKATQFQWQDLKPGDLILLPRWH